MQLICEEKMFKKQYQIHRDKVMFDTARTPPSAHTHKLPTK